MSKEILFFLSFTVRTYENNTMMSLFQNVESSSISPEFWIVYNKTDDADQDWDGERSLESHNVTHKLRRLLGS
ncbi:hypothetical protein IQA89_19370 [Leptospira borgpetersenii serovar Balcanica]|nr:hypothetical protein [Leptospira borgpetersenii serovar Balcanica]MBE8424712.1 hypothetical protein [Leptospira borgpetersenii serovar Balcanica]